MQESDAAANTTDHPAAHGWRRLILAALIMGLSMAVASVLIPPDPDVAAAIGDIPDR
jgi:hypothetical protein